MYTETEALAYNRAIDDVVVALRIAVVQVPADRAQAARAAVAILDDIAKLVVNLKLDAATPAVASPPAPAAPAIVEMFVAPPPSPTKAAQRAVARAQGYTGDVCNDCGNVTMVRNGTCLKCETCGGTTGCS